MLQILKVFWGWWTIKSSLFIYGPDLIAIGKLTYFIIKISTSLVNLLLLFYCILWDIKVNAYVCPVVPHNMLSCQVTRNRAPLRTMVPKADGGMGSSWCVLMLGFCLWGTWIYWKCSANAWCAQVLWKPFQRKTLLEIVFLYVPGHVSKLALLFWEYDF